MGVKVTGQFEPAGDFSIVDAKDVSGNITGSFISASQVTLGDSNFTGNMTASGDFNIQGSVSGSITSTGSFGRLEIAGDSSILGDVTIGGNINIGDSDTDSLTISADLTSNLIPNADSTFNLGSPTKNWKEGYIEELSSTNITASGDISGSGISTGSLGHLRVVDKITAHRYGGNISGSATSTGSFGRVVTTDLLASGESTLKNKVTIKHDSSNAILEFRSTGGSRINDIHNFNSTQIYNSLFLSGNNGVIAQDGTYSGGNTRASIFSIGHIDGTLYHQFGNVNQVAKQTGMGILDYDIISGSAVSTGSFGHVKIPDDGRLSIGNSNDLQLYHNGNHSFIKDGGSGNLILLASAFQVKNSTNNETMIQANEDGAVTLFYDNTQRLVTTPGGLNLTGNITGSGNLKIAGDLVVDGKVTAQEFHTEIVSSSIVFTSGSTKFGDTSDDTHDFTGSINLRGSEIFFGTSSDDRTNITLKGHQARIQYRHYTNNALYTYLNLASGGSILNTNFANNVNELFKIQANETTQWKFTTDIISGSNQTTASFHHIHGASKLGVGTISPISTVHISASDGIIIPAGTDAERNQNPIAGEIRFNTQQSSYEGYDGNNWGTLGGMADVDKDTFITAENSAGVDNDELKFFTAGTERLRIFADGHISASGDITASKNLQVDGDVTTSVTSTGSFGMIKKDGLDIREHFSRNTVEAFELDENGDFIPTEKDQYMVDPKWELDENGDLQRRERELWTFDWDSYFSD